MNASEWYFIVIGCIMALVQGIVQPAFALLFGSILGVSILPRCIKCRRCLAMRILSVRLSVRPSVKRVHCDKTKERSVQILCLTNDHLA